MKIEKTEAWKVNGITFSSEEDAREYVKRIEAENQSFNDNVAAIQAAGNAEFFPIQIFRKSRFPDEINEFSFITKLRDGEWRECCSGDDISYISEYAKIKILTPGEFMNGFSSCDYEIASSTWFGYFVKYAAKMNTLAGDIMSVEEFAEVLSRVEISPF